MRPVFRLSSLLCLFCCVLMTCGVTCEAQNTPSPREAALLAAIENKDIARVRALLAQGVDLRVKDEDGFTPLHNAALHDSAMVQLLLEHGASVGDRDKQGNTPLLLAGSSIGILSSQTKIMQILLDYGANINEADNDGYTVLHKGAYHDSSYITKFTLIHGADIQRRTKRGDTALILASNWLDGDAFTGHEEEWGLETVKLLQAHGASINAANKEGFTALMAAASGGRERILAFLLTKGAKPNQKDKQGRTALTWAAWGGYDSDNVRALRKQGAQIGVTEALLLHDAPLAQSLMERGAAINVPAPREGTALLLAAREGAGTLVRVLLDRGMSINARNAAGATALMLATGSRPYINSTYWEVSKMQQGRAEIVTLLLMRGADINAQDEQGYTALMYAAAIGQEDVVKVLLAHNADVNRKTNDGYTALQLATERHHDTVVRLLKQAGATDKSSP